MRRETEIAMAAAEVIGSKYDEVCKELFQNKEIIAPILREVVPEYRNSTLEEVIGYIDADSIEDDPVDDVSVRIEGLPTEQGSVSDKLIRYDTHFKAVNPILSSEGLCIHLHIDLEVQNNYRPESPSYPIVKRGIYYVAREISGQLGVLTERTDYGALQKSYSIWICNERIPGRLQNTVSMYSVRKTDLIGKAEEPKEDYDLMSVILIRRGRKADIPIFEYLSGIFDCDRQKMAKYVDIESSEPIRKGVEAMSGLGQTILDKGIQEGETLLATLVGCLKRDGRLNDLDDIADDEKRKRLYREYGLLDC